MAVIEQNALVRVKDAQKNSYLIYPITKAENVDGLTEALAPLASSESVNNAKSEAISTAAADATSKANQAVTDSKAYTDSEVAKDRSRLSALEAVSTTHALTSDVTALASRVTTAEGEIDTLQSDLDTKADSDHNHDSRYYTESEINSKLSGKSDVGHTHSQYVNQNAFSKVTVGSTTIEADNATDTLTLAAGSNITLTPDASGDKVTITAKDTVYTHPNSGVTAGTYKSVTVNAQGHVTAGTNPTTLAGYGITDAETKGAAATALSQAKTYADSAAATAANNVKNDLLNGAGAAYDTLKELGDLIDTNTDAIDALEAVATGKADASHTHTVSHTPAGTIASKSITPSGSVSSTFTGTAASHSHTFTGTAASHNHTFTGTKATISADYTPVGSVSSAFTGKAVTSGSPSGTTTVASSTHTHKYTPSGTVSKPTFTGSAVTSGSPSGTTSVYSITGVGSVPSLSASVTNRCLTLSFSAGSVPTRSSVTVASSGHTHSVTASGTVSQPTFTGTEASTTSISGTTSVASSGHTHSVTASGSVASTFTGTEDTISTTYTPAGTIASKSITPAGSISNTSVTPAGSVSSTFTGTAASHSHTFTGTAATLTTSSAE